MLTRMLASIILVLAVAAILDAGPTRIAILNIRQKGMMEPSSVTVFVSVPPAPENRGYRVTALCHRDEGLSTSTFRQLEGEASVGPFIPVEFRLSGCVYEVRAWLLDERDRVIDRSEPRTVRVLCRSCPNDEDEQP